MQLMNLSAWSFDVTAAFLQAENAADEFLYVEVPDGINLDKGKVLQLMKSQYGLRTAPVKWFRELKKTLLGLGLKNSKVDPALFYNEHALVVTHVDDVRLYAKSGHGERYLEAMRGKYQIKIVDLIKAGQEDYLGSVWTFKENQASISNARYIQKLLNESGMENAKVTKIPMQVKQELNDHPRDEKNKEYQSWVGTLLYIGKYRPDISFALNQVTRHCHKNGKEHLEAVKDLIRYLKGTKDMEFCIKGIVCKHLRMQVYSDASFAPTKDKKRRSTTGYLIVIGDTPITWGSKKQSIVALSSREAELVATMTSVQHALALRNMLEEIGINIPTIELYVDNQAVIDEIKRGSWTTVSRHLDVKYLRLSQLYQTGQLEINYIPTHLNVGDMYTKALAYPQFSKYRSLSMCEYRSMDAQDFRGGVLNKFGYRVNLNDT